MRLKNVWGFYYMSTVSWKWCKWLLWSWPQMSDWTFYKNFRASLAQIHKAAAIQNRQVCSDWSGLWCHSWICMSAIPIKLLLPGFSQAQCSICCCVFEILHEHHLGFRLQFKWISDILYTSPPVSSEAICPSCHRPPLLVHACAATLLFVVVNNVLWGPELQSLEEFYSAAQGHFPCHHYCWK